MKTLILAVTALIATASMACPDLTGTFSCTYGDNQPPEHLNVETSTNANGHTVYTINGSMEITMDGVAVRLPDDGDQTNRYLTGSCNANTGVINYKTDLVERGQNVGNGVAISRLYLDLDSNLVQETNSDFLYHGQKYQNHQIVLCERI